MDTEQKDNGPRSPADRRRTARVLANASQAELAELWCRWPHRPRIEYVRGPESGLVMVQGRTGGAGDRFNLGEATVTRATVMVRSGDAGDDDPDPSGTAPPEAGSLGTAYVLGSRPEHAALAAIFDGLLGSAQRNRVMEEVITVLEERTAAREAERRAEARSTVVDFFTVARENDAADEEADA